MLFTHLADLTLDLIAIERPDYFRLANLHADPVACDRESCCGHAASPLMYNSIAFANRLSFWKIRLSSLLTFGTSSVSI